jgi:hypothetical protein
MSKLKGVIIVLILVGFGGAATLFWLTKDRQKQVLDQAPRLIKSVDQQLLSLLKVQTFEVIQGLSVHSRSDALINPLYKLPAAATTPGAPLDETQKAAFNAVRPELVAALDDIHKKAASDELQKRIANEPLMILTPDGKIAAQIPDKEKFGASLKGLPAVEKCLQGVALDGIYELDGSLKRMATTPLVDKNGKIAGCLAAASELGSAALIDLSKTLGMELAIFIRKTVLASTVENSLMQPLSEQLESKEPVWFGEPHSAPWLVDLRGKAFLARVIPLPSGTDPIYLGAIVPVAELFAEVSDAQNRLLLGAGIILIIGLLLVFLLSTERETDKDLERLREGVKTLLEGDKSFSLDADSYVGPYRELARDIAHLVSVGQGGKAISEKSDSLGDLLGTLPSPSSIDKQPFTGSPPSEALDFDKLLDGGPSIPLETGASNAPDPTPLPTSSASSSLELLSSSAISSAPGRATEPTGQHTPEPFSQKPTALEPSPVIPFPLAPAVEPFPFSTASARPTPAPISPSGPKVELPTDLVGIFDERIDTREIKPALPASIWPEQAASELQSNSPPRLEPTRPAFTSPASSPLKMPSYQPSSLEAKIEDQITSSDYQLDQTIIAAVPDELLRASSTLDAQESLRSIPTPLPKPPSISMPPSISLPPITNSIPPPTGSPSLPGRQGLPSASGSEEIHFKDIFEQFVKTKKQCGESTVGLTIEPFAEKLRKNIVDLKSRYKCSSVKFQVYVKNGKAALKATPIK